MIYSNRKVHNRSAGRNTESDGELLRKFEEREVLTTSYLCVEFCGKFGKCLAAKFLPVVKRGHLLLCTHLIGTAIATEAKFYVPPCCEKHTHHIELHININVTKKQALTFLDPYVSANINSLSYSSETLDDDVGTILKVQASSHVEEHQDNAHLGLLKIIRQHS